MKDVLTNLLKLEPHNLIPQVNYLAGFLWLMVLICTFFSIRSQKSAGVVKIIWALVVVGIPLLGLFAYCLYSLTKVDWAMFPSLANGEGKKEKGLKVLAELKAANRRPAAALPSHTAPAPHARIIKADRSSTDPLVGEQ